MAEIANQDLRENRVDLATGGKEFIPDPNGVVRVPTPHGLVTIVNGRTADGEESAIVFGVDYPIELVTADDSKESEGFLSGLTRHPLGRIAAGITLAAGAVIGAGAAITACTPATPNNPNQPAGIYGTHQSALTLDQILNVGQGQQIPWSINGDDYPSNRVVINGENYLFATRNGGSIAYVKCQALADCLSPNANFQTLQGLNAAGLVQPGSGWAIDVYQNQAGNNKALIDDEDPFGNEFNHTCDIDSNANGVLEVSNCVETIPPWDGKPSVFPKNGIPHVLWTTGANVKDRNLYTNVTVNTAANADWADSCGVGVETEDGTAVIGSQKQVIQGVTHCRLVTASSWAELVVNPIALQSLNQGSNDVSSPRLFGNYIVYRYNSKLRFVEIPAPPQNPEDAGDTGSPDADTAKPDAAIIDEPDAIDGPEVDQPDAADQDTANNDTGPEPDTEPAPNDVAEEVADAADAVLPPEDAQPDSGPDLPPPPVDTGPDAQPETDTPPDTGPDTLPDPCSFAKPKVNIQPGCQLANCTNPSVDITGKCTFSVDLGKANPVVIELDGTYQVDLLEKIGAHLAGKYQVADDGNGFNTVTGNLITGVEGTTYSGEFMAGSNYLLSCQEGKIKIFLIKANGEKELLATLDGGESQTFDMNNPQPEPNPEPQPEPTPDADQPQPEPATDAGSPQPEPDKDTSSPQPEPTPAIDAGTNPEPETPPVPSKPPSNDGGCNTTGENPNSAGHLATLALALMALGTTIRRKNQPATKPASNLGTASILTRTWDRVARSLGLRR